MWVYFNRPGLTDFLIRKPATTVWTWPSSDRWKTEILRGIYSYVSLYLSPGDGMPHEAMISLYDAEECTAKDREMVREFFKNDGQALLVSDMAREILG